MTVSMTFGALPERAAFIAHVEPRLQETDGVYEMTLVAKGEVDAVVAAVNQGIDAHLEAVFCEQFVGPHGKWGLRVKDVGSLHTLLRRLIEDASFWADDSPHAQLCSAIMTTVDYEWV